MFRYIHAQDNYNVGHVTTWRGASHGRTKSLAVTSIPNSSTSAVSTSPKSARHANITALDPF